MLVKSRPPTIARIWPSVVIATMPTSGSSARFRTFITAASAAFCIERSSVVYTRSPPPTTCASVSPKPPSETGVRSKRRMYSTKYAAWTGGSFGVFKPRGAARAVRSAHVGRERAHDPTDADGAVLEEAAVLGRDHRLADRQRHPLP